MHGLDKIAEKLHKYLKNNVIKGSLQVQLYWEIALYHRKKYQLDIDIA